MLCFKDFNSSLVDYSSFLMDCSSMDCNLVNLNTSVTDGNLMGFVYMAEMLVLVGLVIKSRHR